VVNEIASPDSASRVLVVIGGAGFIGTNVLDLLGPDLYDDVIVIDDFSNPSSLFPKVAARLPNLRVISASIADVDRLVSILPDGADFLHLASNADISASAADPTVDFWAGTFLTQCALEVARLCSAKAFLYASGSGVYGDHGPVVCREDETPLRPNSPYGASKLAGEALCSSYASMFGIKATCFRFANVVGRGQTHGVGHDFIRRLRANPSRLEVLGNGAQSKSYISVEDVFGAIFKLHDVQTEMFSVFNVATPDSISVKEIADLAIETLRIEPHLCLKVFGELPQGWPGDVPLVRLSSDRARSVGWEPKFSSRDAIVQSLRAIAQDSDDRVPSAE